MQRSTRPPLFALALLTLATAGLQAQNLNDANIVAIFDQANTADIESGTLAASRAASREVRDLAESFAAAHQAVRQQGRDLAARLGVHPMLPAGDRGAAQHAAAMASLKKLRGAEFDRAFLDHEIAFHQAVIDAVTTTLLPAISNQELKALVEKVAPAFVAHLEQAKTLRQRIS